MSLPNVTLGSSSSSSSFERFLQGWCHRQEALLAEMMSAVHGKDGGDHDGAEELISRALGHFEELYDYKSRAAHHNVFALFSPTWSCSLECAFLWITGFRPTILFQIVSDSVSDLSDDQIRTLNRMRRETKMEEKVVADELARVQESIAAPPHLDVLRGAGRHIVSEEDYLTTMDDSMRWLKVALEEVVTNADTLRVSTASKVVDLLKPVQRLKFLIAALQLQHSMRRLGSQHQNQRDGESQR